MIPVKKGMQTLGLDALDFPTVCMVSPPTSSLVLLLPPPLQSPYPLLLPNFQRPSSLGCSRPPIPFQVVTTTVAVSYSAAAVVVHKNNVQPTLGQVQSRYLGLPALAVL